MVYVTTVLMHFILTYYTYVNCLFHNDSVRLHKTSTLSVVGKHAMCTYHVLARNEKIVASIRISQARVSFEELENKALSTYLKVAFNFYDLSLRRLLPHLQ